MTSLLNCVNSYDFVLFALAKEYFKIADFARSIEFFEQLIQKNKNYTGAYYHFALALREQGLEEKAMEIIHRGIEICKETNQTHDRNELLTLLES